MKRFPELDSLRAFAIASVVLFHYFPVKFPLGWLGVDLFFVLSGFLITSVLCRLRGGESPYRAFYGRRAIRIFPLYFVVLVVVALLAGKTNPLPALLKEFTFTSSINLSEVRVLWVNASNLIHGRQLIHAAVPMRIETDYRAGLGVMWSLSVEELFYLFWAPVVLIGTRRVAVLMAFAGIVVSFGLRLLGNPVPDSSFFPCRLDGLMMGSLLAFSFYGVSKEARRRRASRFALVVMLLVASVPFWPIPLIATRWSMPLIAPLISSVFYVVAALVFTAVIALCVAYSGALGLAPLRLKPVCYVGVVSYCIYLVHATVMVAVGNAWIASAITLLLAAASWKWFEGPLLRLRPQMDGASQAQVM
jgi:peptidoglycan/LPS O-acetylase OafA/YrhL